MYKCNYSCHVCCLMKTTMVLNVIISNKLATATAPHKATWCCNTQVKTEIYFVGRFYSQHSSITEIQGETSNVYSKARQTDGVTLSMLKSIL